MILLLLSLSFPALAENPTEDFPSEILYVPPGSSLTLGGKKYKTDGKTWLFPEEHYQSAITKAQKLEVCEPTLIKLREDYSVLLKTNAHEVSSCASLLGEAHKGEELLTRESLKLEADNAKLQVELTSARKSALLAWSVTGALLVGAGTVVYIAAQ